MELTREATSEVNVSAVVLTAAASGIDGLVHARGTAGSAAPAAPGAERHGRPARRDALDGSTVGAVGNSGQPVINPILAEHSCSGSSVAPEKCVGSRLSPNGRTVTNSHYNCGLALSRRVAAIVGLFGIGTPRFARIHVPSNALTW